MNHLAFACTSRLLAKLGAMLLLGALFVTIRPADARAADDRLPPRLEGPVEALVGGRFADAAAQLAAMESSLDPYDDEHDVVAELRTFANELASRRLELLPVGTGARPPRPPVVRPGGRFDDVHRLVADGELARAQQTLASIAPIERSERLVARALERVIASWRERGVVPALAPGRATSNKDAGLFSPESRRGEWYGWQLLFADAPLLGTTVVAAAVEPQDRDWWRRDMPIAFASSFALSAFAPALVHLGHGRRKVAVTSLALRLGAPAGGAIGGAVVALPFAAVLGGMATTHSAELFAGTLLFGAFAGGVAGTLTAMVIDTAFLSYETVPPSPPARTAMRPVLRPFIAPSRGGLEAGVGATF